jgi:hypothetical protein
MEHPNSYLSQVQNFAVTISNVTYVVMGAAKEFTLFLA